MSPPRIGIWWIGGETVAVLSHPYTQNATRIAGRLDSNLAHVDEWPRVAARFGCTADDEYFAIPRGRVLWDAKQQCGIIIHGPSINRQCLEVIASRFYLGKKWKAEEDLHYATGADADRLFDDDEEE